MKTEIKTINGVKKVTVRHKNSVFIIQGKDVKYWERKVNSMIYSHTLEYKKDLLIISTVCVKIIEELYDMEIATVSKETINEIKNIIKKAIK